MSLPSAPVSGQTTVFSGIAANDGGPWVPAPAGYAFTWFQSANTVDGSYLGRYGLPWVQLPSTDPYAGAPRNNVVRNVFPFASQGQPYLVSNKFFPLGLCPVDQPQGPVAPYPYALLPPGP